MKLSAKSRYALASVIKLASVYEAQTLVTVLEISTSFDISKIYLERVFSELKQGGIVNSIKGAQGGYYLSRAPEQISLYDILKCVEPALFSENDKTVEHLSPIIEKTLQEKVYSPLDASIYNTLRSITLNELSEFTQNSDDDYMYYL